MGIRFESNYQRIAGVSPYLPVDSNPLTRWIRVHEWQVDPGFTSNLLMVMLNVEPQFPTPVTVQYGFMRVSALLNTANPLWETKYEVMIQGGTFGAKQFTPRLVILPTGSGINFTAGQGLMTTAIPASTTVYRWWSCYVIDANAV